MSSFESEIAAKLVRPHEQTGYFLNLPDCKQERLRIGWRIDDALDALWHSFGAPAGRLTLDVHAEGRTGKLWVTEAPHYPAFLQKLCQVFGQAVLIPWYTHASTYERERIEQYFDQKRRFDPGIHGTGFDPSFFLEPARLEQLEQLAKVFRLRELSATLKVLFEHWSRQEKSTVPEPFEPGVPGVALYSTDRRGVARLHETLRFHLGESLVRHELCSPHRLYEPSAPSPQVQAICAVFDERKGDCVVIDGGYLSIPTHYDELLAVIAAVS